MKKFVVLGCLLAGAAFAQQGPSEIWGLIYNLAFPTLSDKQQTTWQATSAGRLNVTGIPVGACDGTIDLSTGCAMPMLGGL